MITALELRNQLAFALDAEGSDHYLDSLDYIPAINASVKWLTSVINSAYGQNKIGEEIFRELAYSGVFLTNNNSRVSLDVFPEELWTILSVYVKIDFQVNTLVPVPATPDTNRSYYLDNLIHIASSNSCKRLSVEEWATSRENPFENGYEGNQVCDSLKRYAYLSTINYRSSNIGSFSQEIEIRPRLINEKVTIFWVKKPNEILTINDVINFPNSVFQLLFDKALNYISYKQGDQTTLNSVSTQDIQQLLTLL